MANNKALTLVIPGLDSKVVRSLDGVSLTVGEMQMLAATVAPEAQADQARKFLEARKLKRVAKQAAKQTHFSVELYTNKAGEVIGVILRGPGLGWNGLFLTASQFEQIIANREAIAAMVATIPKRS